MVTRILLKIEFLENLEELFCDFFAARTLYWCDESTGSLYLYDGSSHRVLYNGSQPGRCDVTLSGSRVYWTANRGINHLPLGGGEFPESSLRRIVYADSIKHTTREEGAWIPNNNLLT